MDSGFLSLCFRSWNEISLAIRNKPLRISRIFNVSANISMSSSGITWNVILISVIVFCGIQMGKQYKQRSKTQKLYELLNFKVFIGVSKNKY